MKAPIYIFEGTWWNSSEVPLILPYFQALAGSHGGMRLSHRTIRSIDDVQHYVKNLRVGEQAFLYFACHGEDRELLPSGRRSRIARIKLLSALSAAKRDSIGFLHFGCCEIVDRRERRKSLEELLQASGSRWVSGYTRDVDWLRSTMLDLALVAEFYVQFHGSRGRCGPRLKAPARQFVSDYEQLARSLGFSGLSRDSNGGRHQMFPPRLRD